MGSQARRARRYGMAARFRVMGLFCSLPDRKCVQEKTAEEDRRREGFHAVRSHRRQFTGISWKEEMNGIYLYDLGHIVAR